MGIEQVVGELPPAKLPQVSTTGQTIDRMPDLTSADFTEPQVRRKTGGRGDSGVIPRFVVAVQSFLAETIQLRLGSFFARLPGIA